MAADDVRSDISSDLWAQILARAQPDMTCLDVGKAGWVDSDRVFDVNLPLCIGQFHSLRQVSHQFS